MSRVRAISVAIAIALSSHAVADEVAVVDAGTSETRDAAPASAARSEALELEARLAEIRSASNEHWNSSTVAEHLGIDLGDANAVEAALVRLRQDQPTLELELKDREAVEANYFATRIPAKA